MAEGRSNTLLLTGVPLLLISWMGAWSRLPIVTEYSFFPLWIGYILTINGVTELAYRDSLVRKMKINFLILFAASVPFWWFFEMINLSVQNWHYIFPHEISPLQFAIQASIDFSTVIPAVMSTVLLFNRYFEMKGWRLRGPTVRIRRRWLATMVMLGFVFSLLMTQIPNLLFPLVWIAPLLVIEPIMLALGYPSLLQKLRHGEWRLPAVIMIATLFTGIWWEAWNAYSSPKWIYTIPYLGFWKIFEMPFLGYFGYPFFGLVLFSYTMFIVAAAVGNERAEMLVSGIHSKG